MLSAGKIIAYLTLDNKQFVQATKTAKDKVKKHTASMTSVTEKAGKSWWHTYGRVALGFTVAYRAMNVFEHGLRALIGSFGEAIEESGELAAYQAKLAMFYRISTGTTEEFAETYAKAAGNVQALAKASVRALDPLSDLTTGMDELAQAGVFVTKAMTPAFVSLISYTKLVAMTTGSSMRQVRQEFQALTEGRIRTTDILARTLKRFGILTRQDIRDLKAQVNVQKIMEKLASEIHVRWEEIRDVLVASDIRKAMEYWNKSLRALARDSVTLASEMGGVGNVFAKIFAEYAERFPEMFDEKDTARYVLVVNDLAKALDWVLKSFESMLKGMLKGWTFIHNFIIDAKELIKSIEWLDRSVTFLTKAFLGIMGARFVVLFLKEFGLVAVWLATSPIKILVKALAVLYTRFLLIPLGVTVGMTALKAFDDTIVEMTPKIGKNISDMIHRIVDEIEEAVPKWMRAIGGFLTWFSKTMGKGAYEKLENWAKVFGVTGDELRSLLDQLKGDAASPMGKALAEVLGTTTDDLEKLLDLGEDFNTRFVKNLKKNTVALGSAIKDTLVPALDLLKELFPELTLPDNYDEVVAKMKQLGLDIGELTGGKGKEKPGEQTARDLVRSLRLQTQMFKDAGISRIKLIEVEANLEYQIRTDLIKKLKIKEDLRTKLLELAELVHKQKLLVIEGDFVDGVKQGMKDIQDSTKTTFESARDIVKDSADAMRSFMSDGFFSLMKLDLDSLEDAWKSFGNSIQRIIADALAQQTMLAIFGAGGPLGSLGITSTLGTKGMQSGGWIPEPVFGFGQNSGRPYAFAEKEPEMIMPGGSGGAGSTINLTIQAVDAKSFTDLVKRNPGAIIGPFVRELAGGNRALTGSIRSIR